MLCACPYCGQGQALPLRKSLNRYNVYYKEATIIRGHVRKEWRIPGVHFMNKWLTSILFVSLVLWALAPPVRGQEPKPHFERISLEQGLSQATVFSIGQDQTGFMWFGTQSGLNKYDGYTIKVFRNDPNDPHSMPNDNAGNLFIDHEGIIWIGTWGSGLVRLEPQTEQFTTYKPDKEKRPGQISSDRVQTIYEDSHDNIWVGTSGGGLNKFNRESQTFTVYQNEPDNPKSLSHNRVWRIVEDRAGFLWVATSEGLNKFDPKTETFTRYYNDPKDTRSLTNSLIRVLYVDKAGVLWAGTEEGLNKFDSQTNQFTHYEADPENPDSLSDNTINSLLEDSYGNFWVGTSRGGLNKLDRETGRVTHYQNDPRDPTSLSYNDVRWLYEDNSGVLWIATRGGGVNKLRPNLEQFYYYGYNPDKPNSLSSNDVRAIYVDEAQQLWVGTKGGGLNKFAHGQFTHYRNNPDNPQSLGRDDVYAIVGGQKGVLWLGLAGGGLNKFFPQSETFTRYEHDPDNPQSLSSNDVNVLYVDPNGLLWLGTKGGGLNRFDPKTEQFVIYQHNPDDPASLSSNDVFALLPDRAGHGLWVGTYGGGLDYFDFATQKFSHYRHDAANMSSLSNNDVYALYQEADSNILWVATANGGLNKFNPDLEEFTRYGEEDGLPSQVVYGLLGDKAGNLWLSTSRGLAQFNLETQQFITYDTSDGLASIGYNEEAYYQSAQGELYFGGINGLLRFDPTQIKLNRQPPKTVLTGLNLPHENIPLNQMTELTLSPEDTVLSLEFAALDYGNSAKNQYAYYLEGFDKRWVMAEQRRFATYTNLDAGSYLFQVKSANSAGVWDETGLTLTVTVLPPYWETWWFRLLLVLAIMASGFSFYTVRVRQIEVQRQQLELLVNQRTAELWSTNQHLQTLNDRMQDELAIAREIQQSLLPPINPQWAELDIVCYSISAHEVGGDFYAYHAFDDYPLSSIAATHDKFALAVGDVSGKGMPAALLMAISLASFHSIIPHASSPKQLLSQLDEAIRPYTRTRQQNCALCYIEITIRGSLKHIRAINAGCVPPLIRRANGELEWLEVGGVPLGTALSWPSDYREVSRELFPGDLVILSSDGVVEAMTHERAIFGFERLEQAIQHGPNFSATAMLAHLKTEISRFVGAAEPHDDLTIMVIKV